MIKKRRLISFFKKLVRIESLSLREGNLARIVKTELRHLGIKAYQAGKVRGGEVGNLVANVPGRGVSRPRLILNAHLDTVSPAIAVKPIERNGYIYSDGTTILGADNKAGVAAIIEVLHVLKEKKLKHPPLRIILTVAEEIGIVGAKVLPEKVLRADFGLTLDGGDIDKVVVKAPGQYNLEATIIGRAAHAGIRPEEGINAIKVASEAVTKMKVGRIDKETTANIGVIAGGKATNIVPEEVRIRGEARSQNLAKLHKQVAQMERELIRACQKHKARLKLKVERVYKSFEIKASSPILALVAAGMRATKIKPVYKSTGGGSDANILNEARLPTVNIGVGADHVHTTRERINVAEFIQGTEMVLNIISEAGKWKNLAKRR